VSGSLELTYFEFLGRCEQMAARLGQLGVAPGDRVALLLPNVVESLEAHFAVPGVGAVLVPINTRLGASECAYILRHSGAKVLVTHPVLRDLAARATERLENGPRTWVLDEDTEVLVSARAADRTPLSLPSDEMALISVNYTSGTTGDPKGVMYTHRGAYLQALGVVAESGLGPRSTYLWTLPMFHCNGWAYVWAVTAMGGCHVCLEKFDPNEAWSLLEQKPVTHLCGAPTLLMMLTACEKAHILDAPVRVFVGGAPPSAVLLQRCEALRFEVTHLYGLTETYGPISVCAWQPAWDELPPHEQWRTVVRQGVETIVSEPLRVVDPEMKDVAADGKTMGEVVMRGDNVTVGYFRDEHATAEAFSGGWFHSGDLGVMHPDGYIELRDRAKDIIVSGGENISTIEVEHVLAAHRDVFEAAVVAEPDALWGEVPKAFVVCRPGAAPSVEEIQEWVRSHLAHFKVPRKVVFVGDLPKTATGKVQKFVLRQYSTAHCAQRT
jgi:fatty-acyl-CoA synthase